MKQKKKRNTLINGILWSTRGIGLTIPNTLVVSYLSFYATDVLGMAATLVATLLLLAKLSDGVSDIIAGFIIDNTHSRLGKGRPYDICILFVGISTILLFSAPKTGVVMQAAWLLVMYILLQAVFVTLSNTADSIYLLHVFPEEKERNVTFSVSTVFTQLVSITIGIFFAQLVAAAGTDYSKWQSMVLMVMIPCTIIGMIRFFCFKEADTGEQEQETKEKKPAAKKEKVGIKDAIRSIIQNKSLILLTIAIFIVVISSGFLNTSAAYYFQYIVGDIGKLSVVSIGTYLTLVMLVIFVPLANKFGKDKIMKLGLIISSVGIVIKWLGGTNLITLTIGMGMTLFGIMPISVYFPLFLFDIMDYGEWKTGKRVEAVYSALPSFANKVASGLSVSLAMFVLGFAGYDGTAEVQSASALQAIELTYNIIPMILLVLMTILLVVFYRMDQILPTVRKELAQRRSQPGQEN